MVRWMFIDHAMGLCTNDARIGVQHARVEVSLQDFGSPGRLVGQVAGPPAVGLPIEPQGGARQGRQVLEEMAPALGEHRHGHTVLKPFQQVVHVRQDALDVQVSAQGSCPAVEELDEVDAGVDLGMQVGFGGRGDGRQQGIKQLRLFPQHPPGEGQSLLPLPSTM